VYPSEDVDARLKQLLPFGLPNKYGLLPGVRYFIVATTHSRFIHFATQYMERSQHIPSFIPEGNSEKLRGIGPSGRILLLSSTISIDSAMAAELRYHHAAMGVTIEYWNETREMALPVRFD
jgi:hypothetical protein